MRAKNNLDFLAGVVSRPLGTLEIDYVTGPDDVVARAF